MAWKREGLEGYVREHWFRKLYNPYARFRPFLYFLGLESVERLTKLGRPNTPAVFGDVSKMGKGEMRKLGRSTEIYLAYQKSEPNDGGTVAYRGATPTASQFSEDNMGQAAYRWTHFSEPEKVGSDSLDDATGASAIFSIMDNANNIASEALIKRVNTALMTGTMTQSQQADRRWNTTLGVQHILTQNNYIGQVDRSVETSLNPLNIDATSELDTTAVELAVVDVVNDGNANVTGRAAISPDGTGCNVHFVHPALFAPLREEAQGIYQIHTNGIPGHAIAGHKRPIIEYGNNWIAYDDLVPSTEMWSLRLGSWLMEVDPRYNFQPQSFKDKSKNEEGGERYIWSLINAKIRLSCREPWLQAKTTGLTAS